MPEDVINATSIVRLPCGYIDKDGKIQREAEIAPMTGRVRKVIARPEIRQSGNKVADEILRNCITRVGEITNLSPAFFQEMLGGDRDYLLLKIRQVSSGDVIHSEMICTACRTKLNVDININDIDVTELYDSETEIRDGKRIFYVNLSEFDIKAVFRYPTGRDQGIVVTIGEKNPVEAEYKIYQNCLIEWNGRDPKVLSPSLIEDQRVKTLDALSEEFRKNLPGPDLNITVDCLSCAAVNQVGLESSDFLFPIFQRK